MQWTAEKHRLIPPNRYITLTVIDLFCSRNTQKFLKKSGLALLSYRTWRKKDSINSESLLGHAYVSCKRHRWDSLLLRTHSALFKTKTVMVKKIRVPTDTRLKSTSGKSTRALCIYKGCTYVCLQTLLGTLEEFLLLQKILKDFYWCFFFQLFYLFYLVILLRCRNLKEYNKCSWFM